MTYVDSESHEANDFSLQRLMKKKKTTKKNTFT